MNSEAQDLFYKTIHPLMQKITQICEDNNIPIFAEIQVAAGTTCSYCIYPNIVDRAKVIHLHHLLSESNAATDGDPIKVLALTIANTLLRYGKSYGMLSPIPRNLQFSLN